MLSLNKFFNEPGVVAFTTDRQCDFAFDPDNKNLTQRQKEILAEGAGVSVDQIPFFKQVHGNRVIAVTREFLVNCSLPEADGFVANQLNVPINVRTADCLPVFLFDPHTKTIGLVHAGWRGTKQKILDNTLLQMRRRYAVWLSNLKVIFGPAIGACCYQVGQEFLTYFPNETQKKADGYYFDLKLANKNQLLALGVLEKNIFDCDLCTCCEERYFSYRRDKEKAGRMLSVMMIRGE